MKFRDALNAVLPFAGKPDSGFEYVRVSPSQGEPDEETGICEVAAYVEATDGIVGARVYVDGQCKISILFGAGSLAKAFKVIKRGETCECSPRSSTTYNFTGSTGAHQYVSVFADQGPMKPKGPAVLTPIDSQEDFITAVHACPKPTKEYSTMLSLTHVHLTPGGIETSDESRMCFIRRPNLTEEKVLLPRHLFNKWPTKALKQRAAIGFTDSHAFLWSDGLLRWGALFKEQPFPDLDPHLPASHLGYRTSVDRLALYGAIRDATDTLPTTSARTLELRFGENDLSIQAIDAQPEGDVVTYRHTLEVGTAHEEVVSVLVNGKFLSEALNAHNNSAVTLCYPLKNEDPLRIEDDRATSVISQLTKVQVPA